MREMGLVLGTAAVLLGAFATQAVAQDDDGALAPPPASGARTADSGAFSPWTMAARSDTQRAFAVVQGGYDGAKEGAVIESVLEARVIGRLSLRAGASYVGPDGQARPLFGAKVDALRQESHGIDLAVAGAYEPHGFNTVRSTALLIAMGRRFGDTSLIANAGFGLGLDEGERYGDARLAAFHRVAGALRLGLDSRVRVDLERDSDEPAGEPDWELLAGPGATLTLGRFALIGGAGLSAIRMRDGGSARIGAIVHGGLGAAF